MTLLVLLFKKITSILLEIFDYLLTLLKFCLFVLCIWGFLKIVAYPFKNEAERQEIKNNLKSIGKFVIYKIKGGHPSRKQMTIEEFHEYKEKLEEKAKISTQQIDTAKLRRFILKHLDK